MNEMKLVKGKISFLLVVMTIVSMVIVPVFSKVKICITLELTQSESFILCTFYQVPDTESDSGCCNSETTESSGTESTCQLCLIDANLDAGVLHSTTTPIPLLLLARVEIPIAYAPDQYDKPIHSADILDSSQNYSTHLKTTVIFRC